MSDGGIICAQIVLTVFNVIQFLFGWILIIAGAVLKVNSDKAGLGAVGPQNGAAIFLIVIGCILVVVALTGCFGAWTKNYCLLVTFCVFTAIIFILVLIAVIVAFVARSKTNEFVEPTLKELIKLNDTSAFDVIQEQFKCCGVDNPEDWKENVQYKNAAPPSCCGKSNATCDYRGGDIYREGCRRFLEEALKQPLLIIGAIAAACAFAMILSIIAAAYMAHTIRGSYHAV